jgi:hypothetical protein
MGKSFGASFPLRIGMGKVILLGGLFVDNAACYRQIMRRSIFRL